MTARPDLPVHPARCRCAACTAAYGEPTLLEEGCVYTQHALGCPRISEDDGCPRFRAVDDKLVRLEVA